MHTKRIAVGYGKEKKWLSTPNPGAHPKAESVSLLLVVRDMLGYADNSKEARKIVREGMITVDKRVRKDLKFGVGLMDVVEIPKIKKHFRILPGKKGLALKEIGEEESNIKLCKITGKQKIRKGAIQLATHDGGVITPDKDEYKVNDTLVISLPERKLEKGIKFEKGNLALVFKGRHTGRSGKIKDLLPGTATRDSITTLEDIQTLTSYSFVIGGDKPIIKI